MAALDGTEDPLQPLPTPHQTPAVQLAFGQTGLGLEWHGATQSQRRTCSHKLQLCYSHLTN